MLPDIDRIVESAICTPFGEPLVRSSDEDSLFQCRQSNIPIYFDCAAIMNVNCSELIKGSICYNI